MTYGPVSLLGAPGVYVPTTPTFLGGEWAVSVRQVVDPVQIELANEVSAAYYGYWKQDASYQWGDWNKRATPQLSKEQFDLLSGLISTMGAVAFHYVNLDLGTPIPLDNYWLIDTTYRFHIFEDEVVETDPDVSADGQPLGPEEYVERGPILLAELDQLEAALGASTRGLRDYFIAELFASTAVDITGVF